MFLIVLEKDFFPEEIENIFFEILLPKTKPITVGIIYRPPKENNFLQTQEWEFCQIWYSEKRIIHPRRPQYKLVSKSYRMQKQQSCVSDSL